MLKNFYNIKYSRGSLLSRQSGVTLVELMVVVSIFVIMSLMILFNYGQFRSATSAQNLADDIALSIRKAQSYAIGVRRSGEAFESGYGIHLSLNPINRNYSGSNKLFILFSDITKNNTYDYDPRLETCSNPSPENECLEALSITSTDQIGAIAIGVDDRDKMIKVKDTVDIVFNRPNPEPVFCHRKENSGGLGGPIGVEQSRTCERVAISYVKIFISNPSDSVISKIITVWNNGQISVY